MFSKIFLKNLYLKAGIELIKKYLQVTRSRNIKSISHYFISCLYMYIGASTMKKRETNIKQLQKYGNDLNIFTINKRFL